MTYPLIGNYGVNPEDVESNAPGREGLIRPGTVGVTSNWHPRPTWTPTGCQASSARPASTPCPDPPPEGAGSMKGVISTEDPSADALVEKARRSPGLVGETWCGR